MKLQKAGFYHFHHHCQNSRIHQVCPTNCGTQRRQGTVHSFLSTEGTDVSSSDLYHILDTAGHCWNEAAGSVLQDQAKATEFKIQR